MKGSAEVAKGRIKEAAGVLVNNDKLRARGRTDQAVGRVKRVAEAGVRQAKDKARKFVDKAKSSLSTASGVLTRIAPTAYRTNRAL